MSSPCFLAAHELRDLLASRAISARELVQECIAQHRATHAQINGLVTTDFGLALETAAQLDAYQDRHRALIGPLHGLPLAVKDVFATRGLRTTYGNTLFSDHIPEHDDWLVARERRAGAVLMGKSNTPDCASGGRTTNEIFGLSRNPWNHRKTCSGSGGGGVAALISGAVVLADGSDIGGSVRSPAAWTNCVGYRPSSGRIPGPPGAIADGQVSTAGVFARCVADAVLFVSAVEGGSPGAAEPFPSAQGRLPESLSALPDGVRAAWLPGFAEREIHPELLAAFEGQRSVFESAGIALSESPLALGPGYRQLYRDYNAYGTVKGLPERVLAAYERAEPVKPSIADNLDHFFGLPAKAVHAMLHERDRLRVRTQHYMADHDVLITPAHAGLAYGAEDEAGEAECDWAAFYHAPLLGLPSVVVPGGFSSDGMPHGLMITGRAGEDALVLQVAQAFEQRTQYWRRRPPGY